MDVVARILLEQVPSEDHEKTIAALANELPYQHHGQPPHEPDENDFAKTALVTSLLKGQPYALNAHGPLCKFVFGVLEYCDEKSSPSFLRVVQLCRADAALESAVLVRASMNLLDLFKELAEHAHGFVVDLEEDQLQTPKENVKVLAAGSGCDDHAAPSTKVLAFLKALFLSRASIATSSWLLPGLILALTAASSRNIASLAGDAITAFLTRAVIEPREQPFGSIPNAYSVPIWRQIRSLLLNPVADMYRTMAFKTWLRWVTAPDPTLLPSRDVLRDQTYWRMLLSGLSVGSQEQRKICLSILNLSSSMVHGDLQCNTLPSDIRVFRSQFAKYSTLFETIVINRYLNQIHDSFGDFRALLSPHSLIDATWRIALLTAALSNQMQNSIRKLVGTWIMDSMTDLDPDSPNEQTNFLTTSFLPWAVEGPLYTSGIKQTAEGTVISKHGEKLVSFLSVLLQNSSDDELHGMLASKVLNYVDSKGKCMFPYARMYLLQGLVKGLSKISEPCLEPHDEDVLKNISSGSGYAEVARDLMVTQCDQMLNFVKRTSTTSRGDGLKTRPQTLTCTGPSEPETYDAAKDAANATDPMWPIYEKVRLAQANDHRGDRLGQALHDLRYLVENVPLGGIDGERLLEALSTMWAWTRQQDYPKRILLGLPSAVLHPRVFDRSEGSSQLKSWLQNFVSEFQRLSETKIYAFAPLAAAMRRLHLQTRTSSSTFVEDFVLRFAKSPPVPRVEFQLEQAASALLQEFIPQRNYSHYYGKSQGYGYACVFDMLMRFRDHRVGKVLLDKLVEPWLHQKQPSPVFCKWKTTEQLQAMLILCDKCLSDQPIDDISTTLQKLTTILSIEPLPRFRFLLEWMITRIYLKLPEHQLHLLNQLSTHDHHNSKNLASLIKVGTVLACAPINSLLFSTELMARLVPLAASSKVVIRHEAQWSFPQVWDNAVERGWFSLTTNPAFSSLNAYIRSLERYQDAPLQRILERLDPIKDHTITNLFQGNYLKIEPPERNVIKREDFLELWIWEDDANGGLHQDDVRIPLGEAVSVRESPVLQATDTEKDRSPPAIGNDPPTDNHPNSERSVPLQTKGALWQENALANLSLEDASSRRANGLIVVASLIENAYNLGGLSRVSEIFGAQSLQVRNLNVVKSKDFSSVAVASELWLPIQELPLDGLSSFLAQKKLEGYCAVGIEQTDSSEVLGQTEWRFPEKTVLVLGSEREGIPASVLADMDVCVEIRQAGLTRSMNVQTAAAVALYEYSRQLG